MIRRAGGSIKRSSIYNWIMAMPRKSSHGISCGSGVLGRGSSSRNTIIISGGAPRRPDRPSRCKKLVTELGA